MADLGDVQQAFTQGIRSPLQAVTPKGVTTERYHVYQELLYNNIDEMLQGCFPVCYSLLDDATWALLLRGFMCDHSAKTPLFHQIGEEFIAYCRQNPSITLPDFFIELAHYEWMELAIDLADDVVDFSHTPQPDWHQPVQFSSVAQVLVYAYPVQQICVDYQPSSPSETPTVIIVNRNRNDAVCFTESDLLTAQLLQTLSQQPELTLQAATRLLLQAVDDSQLELLMQQAKSAIDHLWQRDVLWASTTS